MELKLKVGAVQERLISAMHGLGQYVQDSVQTHSEIRRQTDKNLKNDCIRKGKCRPRKQNMHNMHNMHNMLCAEYAEYVEYAEYAKNTQKIRKRSWVHIPLLLYAYPLLEYNKYAEYAKKHAEFEHLPPYL